MVAEYTAGADALKITLFHGYMEESCMKFKENYEMLCELKGWTTDHQRCYYTEAYLRDYTRSTHAEIYEEILGTSTTH